MKLVMIRLKSYLKILIATLLLSNLLNAFFTDPSLPTINGVKSVVDRSAVGFEWKSLATYPNVQGVNIYRAEAKKAKNQTYTKIASVPTRYATHYVDTNIKPNKKYFYTFTTFSGLSESLHGDIVPIKTKPPYKPVKFVSASLVDVGVVKLLWVPSSEPSVLGYIIQRNCSNDNRWHFLDRVKGRLYPEYIDTRALRGYTCRYRVFAEGINGLTSYVGKELSVKVR